MRCRWTAARTSAYLDGTLPESERSWVEDHLRECAECRESLEELRSVVRAAGLLRPTAEPPAREYAAAVDELRRRAIPGSGARVADIPLGIGEQAAAFGDHVVFPWEHEDEFRSTAGFLATGLERGEACVLFGHEQANRRVLETLGHLGVSASRLLREERLFVAAPDTSSDALLGALDEQVKTTVDRGVIGVRVLGNLGWGMAGWPVEDELLRLEARVTDAVRLYPAVVVCAYDLNTVSSRALLGGGLECHPWVLQHGCLRSNDSYVPCDRFPTNSSRAGKSGAIPNPPRPRRKKPRRN